MLRSEGPRDYIDLLLSMAHKQNIVISDMANMLVAHSKNRTNSMFHTNDGMVAEPTEENIKLDNEGKLGKSFSWIEGEKPKDVQKDAHPVSGSTQYFDRFHEKNVK